MRNINDGGQAFPSQLDWWDPDDMKYTKGEPSPGMTLRDYFAAKAMPLAWKAELAEMDHFNEGCTSRDVSPELFAKRAYQLADAMLAARGGAQ